MSVIRKSQNIKRSVSFTPEMLNQLDSMAAKQGVPTSTLIRKFIDQGMSVEKTKDDIDFIRKQIREELEIAFENRMSRIIKLLIKIGVMVYPVAYYNTMLAKDMAEAQGLKHKDYMEAAKKEGAKALAIESEAVDTLYDEINKFGL